jgi:hypothetical protein
MTNPQYGYEIRSRKDHRGFDLISDVLPFCRLWYGEPNAVANAIGYAAHYSRSHHAVIRVYDDAGNVIENVKLRRLRDLSWSAENLRASARGVSLPVSDQILTFHVERPFDALRSPAGDLL